MPFSWWAKKYHRTLLARIRVSVRVDTPLSASPTARAPHCRLVTRRLPRECYPRSEGESLCLRIPRLARSPGFRAPIEKRLGGANRDKTDFIVLERRIPYIYLDGCLYPATSTAGSLITSRFLFPEAFRSPITARAGFDHGRIHRLIPKDSRSSSEILSQSSEALVEELKSFHVATQLRSSASLPCGIRRQNVSLLFSSRPRLRRSPDYTHEVAPQDRPGRPRNRCC